MKTTAQTVMVVTGERDDFVAALNTLGPLTPDTMAAMTGDRPVRLPQPVNHPEGQWVFPGSHRDVFRLARVLSCRYPRLTWYCDIPSEGQFGDHYTLMNGVGVHDRRVPRDEAQHGHLPAGDAVIYRVEVGEKSSVLASVFVQDGQHLIDVTDEYFNRRFTDTFDTPEREVQVFDWDDDDDILHLTSHVH